MAMATRGQKELNRRDVGVGGRELELLRDDGRQLDPVKGCAIDPADLVLLDDLEPLGRDPAVSAQELGHELLLEEGPNRKAIFHICERRFPDLRRMNSDRGARNDLDDLIAEFQARS